MSRRRVGRDVMAEADPAASKRAAVQRVQARRRAGRGPADSEFEDPQTVDEWVDDCLVILPPFGPYAALITILEDARQGEASAAAAVRTAAGLSSQEQFDAYATLCGLPEPLTDARSLLAAIRAGWHRQGLQVTRPEPQPAAEAGAG
jgi:hypothetical protein